MAGDELHLDGKLPPVVQYLDALSQLVSMHVSGLKTMRLIQVEISNLERGLDSVVDQAVEKIINKSK
jgi:hypothetical protein